MCGFGNHRLKPENRQIIEIGAVKVRGGKITDTFQTLVNPCRSLEERITGITGITDDMLLTSLS